MQKNFIAFNVVKALVESLAIQIELAGKSYLGIYGIARGGLIPAVMLSHRLNVPVIPKPWSQQKGMLIVDDIADSGTTLSKLTERIESDTATLHYKPQSIIKPTYFGVETPNEMWIVYPWEREQSQPMQDYLIHMMKPKTENNE